MADRPKPPNARLRAVRVDELQRSRQELAKLIVETGKEMGETVACTARLVTRRPSTLPAAASDASSDKASSPNQDEAATRNGRNTSYNAASPGRRP